MDAETKTFVIGKPKHGLECSPKSCIQGLFISHKSFQNQSVITYTFFGKKVIIMKSMTLGYARVSTDGQNLDRQIDALNKYGVDILFNEKMSGTKRERPELNKLIERMSAGDTVVIESLSRLGRSTKDLIGLMELFRERGVNLVSLKESIDTSSSTGKLLFTLMSALAQFERDLISERTVEGLKAARARGRIGGRPKKNDDQIKKAVKMYNTKQYSLKEIEEMTGIKKSTLYRRMEK